MCLPAVGFKHHTQDTLLSLSVSLVCNTSVATAVMMKPVSEVNVSHKAHRLLAHSFLVLLQITQ